MSNLKSLVRDISKSLTVGASTYIDCPLCDRSKKFGITKYQDKTLYQCFSASCNARGCLEHALSSVDILNALSKITSPQIYQPTFEVQKHWLNGFNCPQAIALATKFDLMEPYYTQHAFKTSTDLRLMRQVFYYTNPKGEITGASGRALMRSMKKAFIYPGSIKQPWVIGKATDAVIVEDFFSAIKLYNIGRTGIALSGTEIQEDWLDHFKGFNSLTIALDKDASIKSFDVKKLLQLVSNDVRILLLPKDFKDMTRT